MVDKINFFRFGKCLRWSEFNLLMHKIFAKYVQSVICEGWLGGTSLARVSDYDHVL